MIRYANLEEAKRVVAKWRGDPSSVEHLGDRGNSVFSFKNEPGGQQILRFTDPDFRSFSELKAELDFIDYLYVAGVPVAQGLDTTDEEQIFFADCAAGQLICSSIAYAPGIEVKENSPQWGTVFFKEWGRNLALIHESAVLFQTKAGEAKRWQWEDEILITRAEQLIPADDKCSLEEFHEVLKRCKALAKSPSNFGLIHADHAPQNFRFDVAKNIITAFDFGNCCYHWFIADLAISLSTIRRKANREQIRENILEGYSAVRSLPHDYVDLIDLFIRLRVIYVYLSRLYLWSKNRTEEQERDLAMFKGLVHSQSGWTRV